ncbi:hypothetical protein D6C97_09405, partial [Aureobasidium pullulans]
SKNPQILLTSSPDLLTNSFEPQIRETILTIISAVHTTNLAISTYRNLCSSNVHKITAIKHLSLTADAVAIASLRKKYAQLITAEMKMCREVEGMKQGVVMLRLDLEELHELNGSVEERRNDDVEGEGWMPNVGLSRRREEGAVGSQGSGFADVLRRVERAMAATRRMSVMMRTQMRLMMRMKKKTTTPHQSKTPSQNSMEDI